MVASVSISPFCPEETPKSNCVEWALRREQFDLAEALLAEGGRDFFREYLEGLEVQEKDACLECAIAAFWEGNLVKIALEAGARIRSHVVAGKYLHYYFSCHRLPEASVTEFLLSRFPEASLEIRNERGLTPLKVAFIRC